MKLVAVITTLTLLSACATRPTANSQAISLEQLQSIKYTNADCPQIDRHVKFLETQLRLRGLTDAQPEKLSEQDRVYNATARILIWNLRIGCNNPTRFSKR